MNWLSADTLGQTVGASMYLFYRLGEGEIDSACCVSNNRWLLEVSTYDYFILELTTISSNVHNYVTRKLT